MRKGQDMNENQKNAAVGCFLIVAVMVFLGWLVIRTPEKGTQKQQDSEPQTNYSAALSTANALLSTLAIPGTYTTQFERERLVITVTLSSPPTNAPVYAESILLAVRNKLVSSGAGVKSYRVSLHGPSPGVGLVRVYGAYRFTEGWKGTWDEN